MAKYHQNQGRSIFEEDTLFNVFHKELKSKGLIYNEGKLIDASFVVAPKQRNTREENAKIKNGEGYELWNDNKHKKCHKDVDARWAKKRGENYYGYKNHIMADKVSKLIDSYDVTDASVHDSQRSSSLVDEKCEGQHVWLDAGYVGTDAGFAQKGQYQSFATHGLAEEIKQGEVQSALPGGTYIRVYGADNERTDF